MRSPESVVQEVLHLRDAYGVKNVVFWDDHLTTQRDRTVNLCQELIRMRADIRWLTFARANSIDEELLRLMKRAGCHELQIGVESGSERILKMTKKGISLRHIRLAAAVLRKVGIRWHAFLMIGFPGETPDEMQSTIQFIHELRPNSVELSVVTPYPGTEMFEAARRRGTLDETAWLSADPYKAESILVDTMPRDQFRDLVMRYRKECERYNRAQTRWTFRGLSAALSRRLRYVSMGLYKIHFFR
jgi:radical SAM superfamily enzyme YgiQ (UPF0313 family)